MTRRAGLIAIILLVLAPAAPVAGHQLVGRFVTPLPLAAYLAGAALAVAVSFGLVIIRNPRLETHVSGRVREVPAVVRLGLRALGLVAWGWVAIQAVVGGPNADADVATLFLWTFGWVGLSVVSALVGPAWEWLDPFATLFDLIAGVWRRLGLAGLAPLPYPERLSAWPAVVGILVLVWAELVLRASGRILGTVMIAYTLMTLAAMAQYGRDAWRARGETFSVWFSTLGRLAPLALDGERAGCVRRRRFPDGLLVDDWGIARVVLVVIGVASVLYDGLSQSRPFFDFFGMLDLSPATLVLAGFIGIMMTIVLGVGRLVGLRALGAGLVPIAAGYIVAHYLTLMLFDGQRMGTVLSDPLALRWDLLGITNVEPSSDWYPAAAVWALQLVAVVGGHIAGVWAGHAAAVRDGRVSRGAQLPLATLMVVLTATTLWSLGQYVVQPTPGPEATSASPPTPAALHDPAWATSGQ